MIWQLHHEKRPMGGDGEFIAQTEIGTGLEEDVIFRDWLEDVKERYPLPEGRQWVLVNEKSDRFVGRVEKAAPGE